MTNYPITVVIPAYNAASTIKRALSSVLRQTDETGRALASIVVVDDGSTDDTARVVAACAEREADPARVQLISHTHNKGMLAARKTSMQQVQTPFVMFLDADDEYREGALECMLAAQAGTFDIVQCGLHMHYDHAIDAATRAATEAFFRVPARDVFGEDITHLVFRDRETSWNLCGKLMRSKLVREAYKQLPDGYVNLGEDLCTFFVVSCLAQSYRGLGNYQGYLYNINGSGSGALRTTFSLEQFLDQCAIIMPLQLMLDWMTRSGRTNTLMADYLSVRHEHVRALADKLLNHMSASTQAAAFDEFAKLWPLEEVVSACAEVGWLHAADTYRALAAAHTLRCPARASAADDFTQSTLQSTPQSATKDAKPKRGKQQHNKHSTHAHRLSTIALYYHKMSIGGAEQVSADLANLWHSMGYNVVFFCDHPREECLYELHEDIAWVQLPPTDTIHPQNYIERAQAISQAVCTYHIDALVHQQWFNPLLAWDMMTFKGLSVPVCVFIHNFYGVMFYVGNTHEFDAARVLRCADALVVLSQSDHDFWTQFNPRVFVSNNRSTLAPDAAKRSPLSSQNIVWVGRLTPFDKRPAEAIEIFARVVENEQAAARDTDAHAYSEAATESATCNDKTCARNKDATLMPKPPATLTLVGPARWESELVELKALARARGVGERVTFAGAAKDAAPYLRNASVFLMTSRIEGYPLALAEAMAAGLPCVMYELPYLTLVRENAGVCSVPQDDRTRAAAAIHELLNCEAKRHEMGDASFARACELETFDYEALWSDIFDTLAQGSILREDYATIDAQWDELITSFKMGVEYARKPNLIFALKDAAYQTACKTWHRIKPLICHS